MFEVFFGQDKCSVQVQFLRTRYYVKNGRRLGIIPYGTKIDPGTKENPGGEPFVCDTTCELRIYVGGEWLTITGMAKMDPRDVGKFNPSQGRKLALTRALDDRMIHGLPADSDEDDPCVMYDLGFDRGGLPREARSDIWANYWVKFPEKCRRSNG